MTTRRLPGLTSARSTTPPATPPPPPPATPPRRAASTAGLILVPRPVMTSARTRSPGAQPDAFNSGGRGGRREAVEKKTWLLFTTFAACGNPCLTDEPLQLLQRLADGEAVQVQRGGGGGGGGGGVRLEELLVPGRWRDKSCQRSFCQISDNWNFSFF